MVANALASGLVAVVMVFAGVIQSMSRSVMLVDALLAIALFSGMRFGMMWLKQLSYEPRRIEKYVLMIGAGEAAIRLLQEIEHNPRLGISVVGLRTMIEPSCTCAFAGSGSSAVQSRSLSWHRSSAFTS